ncbi:2-oxoglutarate (2OG) and Fe(II)-dependent oxygenase superfamily protein [Actinidia rufa]|uniref:2-oxoglutarate (2OG) and Fe(II)-dependent oxygenase superfamily protein n=1 Tax=Actinidia rufa TaxID=165716 RepID=A0A7J0G0U2_9ERIC|nr:2-oxoglutarate (2OG) and Fe(II)-dependent oxygenase superfamily protein [Actinidia rufa]
MGSLTLPNLLVVDFTKENMKPGSSDWTLACKNIKHALEQHGCFVALYDKVSSELHKAVFNAADELFDLPTETKAWELTMLQPLEELKVSLSSCGLMGMTLSEPSFWVRDKSRDGEWIDVEFPPSSFVVMAGDACQAWSNDRVLSPKHRVTMDKNGKDTRYTIALFSFLSKNIEVPKELIDDENPLQFKPFGHVDLLNFYATDHGRRSQNILKDFCGV